MHPHAAMESDQDEAHRVASDRVFLQEIYNDLIRHGFVEGGKADQMLRDWMTEMRNKVPRLRGRVKQTHRQLTGLPNLY